MPSLLCVLGWVQLSSSIQTRDALLPRRLPPTREQRIEAQTLSNSNVWAASHILARVNPIPFSLSTDLQHLSCLSLVLDRARCLHFAFVVLLLGPSFRRSLCSHSQSADRWKIKPASFAFLSSYSHSRLETPAEPPTRTALDDNVLTMRTTTVTKNPEVPPSTLSLSGCLSSK